ncbi:hypothetical protein BYT27DRAFT_7251456 [Phlegmacium glaucopus]|nr:hypothetical protein BYT27DRAFT_7251456 [Phlegmacium glaucopus]
MVNPIIPFSSPSPDIGWLPATLPSIYDDNDTPRSPPSDDTSSNPPGLMVNPDMSFSFPPLDKGSRPASPLPYDPPTDGGPSAGPSSKMPIARLDNVFNFQIVVFEVENTLFQVLRNGFNVPGTPFEAMFALPNGVDSVSLEGSSLENPIYLPGIKVDHFRSFLRILYPFIDQTPVVEFDGWVGVLNLATMWSFQEIRVKAITRLSDLIKQKTLLERISLAREYRVAKWLRDGYLELSRKMPLEFDELRPAEPYSNPLDRNWEADAKRWEVAARTWETLARICYIQTKAASSNGHPIDEPHPSSYCNQCGIYYSDSFCTCRLSSMVDEVFREELGSMKENPDHIEHPLPWDIPESPIDLKATKKKKSKR